MNILFLTLMEINDFNQKGIYPDLINEFAINGHDIYVVSPCETSNKNRYRLLKEKKHIHLIQALIPDYFGVGFIKKGISSLFIGRRYIKAINKAVPDIKYDLILYSTPPITFCNVIERIKKRDNANTYLLLKDIWPQGPIDIGVLNESGIKGIVTWYFKRKEERLYVISDYIGCMSTANCDYLLNNYNIEKSKIELCPNSIKVCGSELVDKSSVRESNGLPVDKTIFVYGGNLGVAQGIDFIIECLKLNEQSKDTFILIIGAGTEYSKLDTWFSHNNPKNSRLLSHLSQSEYKRVMAACDVGLIFLDHRFTIPNFPSRVLSYMEAKMPVLAATDKATDMGKLIEEEKFGYWCESDDAEVFSQLTRKYVDSQKRITMGRNAYYYLINHYSVEISYETIMSHF